MEHEQQQQQQTVGDGFTSQQRPQQEFEPEGETGSTTRAAGAVLSDAAVVASRTLAGSVSSNKVPTKAGGGGCGGSLSGTAPSSPKRASVGSSGSAGGQPASPGKRQSASSMAAAPRIGAPLPPAPRASGVGPELLQSSPRKLTGGGSSWRVPERQKSVSESDMVAAMAECGSEAPSPLKSAECGDVSRSMSVPGIPSEAVEVALLAATAPTTGPTNRPNLAHDMPLAPRLNNSVQPSHSSLPNPASSAPSSATSTPVLQPLRIPSVLTVGALPPHLSPPLVTSATATTTACSPASNPVSPSASMGGNQAAGTGPVACPSLPSLPQPVAQDGVVLGVEALERQQAELERKRLQAASDAQVAAKAEAERQRVMAQAQHLEQMQREAAHAQAAVQHHQRSRTQSLAMAQAPPSSRLPPRSTSTPLMTGRAEAGPQDDDTAPSSTCPQPPTGEGTRNHPRRTSSFGRFLKTPLKQLRQSSSFIGESEQGAPSTNKHGSEALVVPPKDTGGLLEVEGLWQEDEVKPLVYGYLRKLGRNGQWQKRWFETDGMHLTYYKSRKRTKVLASLDLCHVGAIQIDNTDPSGCTFTIEVADRPYFLSATSEPLCKHWVINLNRVKEARCQVGGFQLVEPRFHHGDAAGADGTDRERTESDECMAPRVVMVANRTRTRAMAPSETEDAMLEMLRQSEEKKADEDAIPLGMNVGGGGVDTAAGGVPPHRASSAPPLLQDQGEQMDATIAAGGGVVVEGAGQGQQQAVVRTNSPRLNLPVLARWHKRRNTLTKLSLRLLRWARSMKTSSNCIGDEDVVMGSPVHPPGRPAGDESFGEHGPSSQPGTHDATDTSDSSQRLPSVGASFSFEGGHAEWINKEKQKHLQSSRMHSGDADKDGASERMIQSVASGGSASVAVQSAATAGEGYESEEETRELS
uniref:PH domain-containing protein n=1 Tax=Odontella aurita TaxID=265563 RepID=A0A7S4HXI2_9STRA|mmetsp:Transcript_1661/g.4434  ORF Transcript_1661/g.4434 Transcript_1661/m.4434 type:complete len:923 (+) Transcript_1661:280-3048(+)|eukprot:CAMPEP_0113530642 /NCGR_PEP_ID=MMETSP0015_2-20120614/3057_1 /TAXON_ID=2838 /ORGANISM="Odontella" /LENGTH=922 /DNA_ID=CAMNT_0000429395 /DNA_START=180 /DNA_END=2948 /DNA_ORIENTATION=+ /assembly_acc=CAM_ASM_000160